MRGLRAASLLEAIVAAVIFLLVFTLTLEQVPRLMLRGDDAWQMIEAERRLARAFDKYGSGAWPEGTYTEGYEGGEVRVRIEPYRGSEKVRALTVEVRVDGNDKTIERKQLIEWYE